MNKTFIMVCGAVLLLLIICGILYNLLFSFNDKNINNTSDLAIDKAAAEEASDEVKSNQSQKPDKTDKKSGIVYVVPDMDKIKAVKDIVYKTDNNKELKLDVYYPLEKNKNYDYPVVLIHGMTSDKDFKDRDYFTSWGRLVAASGFTAITFNWRSGIAPEDISDLIAYVREHAVELYIASDRMSIIAFSKGVEDGVREAVSSNTGFIDSIAAYYGKLPMSILDNKANSDIPPIFIAKAGKDLYFSKECNDEFINKARALGVELTEVIHTEGKHGFDLLNDDEQSYNIIRKSLEFIREKANT